VCHLHLPSPHYRARRRLPKARSAPFWSGSACPPTRSARHRRFAPASWCHCECPHCRLPVTVRVQWRCPPATACGAPLGAFASARRPTWCYVTLQDRMYGSIRELHGSPALLTRFATSRGDAGRRVLLLSHQSPSLLDQSSGVCDPWVRSGVQAKAICSPAD
jgi:hypothetical protein